MIGIIVCGHGRFASGISSALELIAGKQEHFVAVDFDGRGDVKALLQQAVDHLACERIVFFTDILGGAPFRNASLIAQERGQCEVVAGVTAQMLIEACLERDDYDDLAASVVELIENTRMGVTSLSLQLAGKKPAASSSDGGI